MRAHSLRKWANQYRSLAKLADEARQYALAASHLRIAEAFGAAAEELEAKYAELPSLEAPKPGTYCPKCGTEIEVEGFCGVCAEPHKPLTFDEFLSYAVNSCVNGGSK